LVLLYIADESTLGLGLLAASFFVALAISAIVLFAIEFRRSLKRTLMAILLFVTALVLSAITFNLQFGFPAWDHFLANWGDIVSVLAAYHGVLALIALFLAATFIPTIIAFRRNSARRMKLLRVNIISAIVLVPVSLILVYGGVLWALVLLGM